jgi:hypothetical protein
MSSSVCHAPLPARMEAFTTRICLRAVDQYERLLQLHFNKVSSATWQVSPLPVTPRSPPRPERHPRAPSPSICPESPVAIDTRASARRHRSPTTSTRQRLIGQSRRQRRLRQLAVGAMSAELTSPGKTAENEVTRLGRIVAGRRRIFLTSYATDTGVH